jgi:hypothetical protein
MIAIEIENNNLSQWLCFFSKNWNLIQYCNKHFTIVKAFRSFPVKPPSPEYKIINIK